jgi:hypothetical protein
MQKVEGSSPFIRSFESPRKSGAFLVLTDIGRNLQTAGTSDQDAFSAFREAFSGPGAHGAPNLDASRGVMPDHEAADFLIAVRLNHALQTPTLASPTIRARESPNASQGGTSSGS